MATILYLADPVITGDTLKRRHQGQTQLCVGSRAVLTPTAWDYLREHRMQVVRGDVSGAPAAPSPALIAQVQPTALATDTQLVPESRCEQPGQPFGCKTEEFGSGFVEPSACRDCQVHGQCREGAGSGDCAGCNRNRSLQALAPTDLEALVQRITDQIMARLEG
jgi:hypothetical protein